MQEIFGTFEKTMMLVFDDAESKNETIFLESAPVSPSTKNVSKPQTAANDESSTPTPSSSSKKMQSTPAPITNECTDLLGRKIVLPAMPKPNLPRGHADTGLGDTELKKIDDWMNAKIDVNKYPYSKNRDASTVYPNKFRAPVSERDFKMLGFFQHTCKALVCAIQKEMPNDITTKQLVENFGPRYLVGIEPDTETRGGHFSMMKMKPSPGDGVMGVSLKRPISKVLNIIAHELAHGALINIRTRESAGHSQPHTDLWIRYMNIGMKNLGWEFVSFLYPKVCNDYNICDLRVFDQTRVFSESPRKSYGTTFDGQWAP
jgi:hypothetical protein